MNEQIVVAPRNAIFDPKDQPFNGFMSLAEPQGPAPRAISALSRMNHLARRGDVEDDPGLLQPIPYVVLARTTGQPPRIQVFAYERLTGGGEARLHHKISIGIGGHMNETFTPETAAQTLLEEAVREMDEELLFFIHDENAPAGPPTPLLIGVLNDDTDPVQQVHLGLLMIAHMSSGTHARVRETDQLRGDWMDITELEALAVGDQLEKWSRHSLPALREISLFV